MKSLQLIFSNPRYFAPAWVFASLNFWFGTWAIYIPTIKAQLGINKSELGIAIFCLSLGVFTVFPIASKIINGLGVGRATWIGVVLSSVTALFPFLAPNYYSLMAGLFFMGISNGFLDISMNTLVTEIEKEDKQNFMSAAHGFFSLGGVFAGLGSFLVPVIGNSAIHMAIVVVAIFGMNLFLRRNYDQILSSPTEKKRFDMKLFKPLFLLGIVGFMAMGSEGAIVDWSGLYLKEITEAPEALLGTGFLAFSVAMTLGRFLGDGISARIGSAKIMALGALIAIFGFVLTLTEHTLLSIAGFGFIGLGFSVIVPELFRIGGNIAGVDSAQGVSFIAGTGYTGFLLGPVALGFLAESASLKYCFYLLLGCVFLILMVSLAIGKNKKTNSFG